MATAMRRRQSQHGQQRSSGVERQGQPESESEHTETKEDEKRAEHTDIQHEALLDYEEGGLEYKWRSYFSCPS